MMERYFVSFARLYGKNRVLGCLVPMEIIKKLYNFLKVHLVECLNLLKRGYSRRKASPVPMLLVQQL